MRIDANAAAPLIDAQFPEFAPAHVHVLGEGCDSVAFDVNDTWVFRLVLEKVEVKTPQEQGADITVTWHPSVIPDLGAS